MKSCTVLFLAVLLGTNSHIAVASDQPSSNKQVELHWSELATFLARGQVRLVLPDGVTVEGETVAVTPQEMVVLVSKSSDKKAYPKGRQTFSRSSVKTIQLTRVKGAGGRVGFTILGVFAGMGGAAGIAATQPDDGSGSAAAGIGALALVVGGGIAGYYGGKAFDHKTTLIKVLPD